jgi:L-lactate dehydrogenase complex protein LldG
MVETTLMTERENILAQIREALKTPSPAPGSTAAVAGGGARQWLPAVGRNLNDWIEQFGRNAVELKAEFQLLHSADEMRRTLVRLRDAEGWKAVGCHSGALTDAICPALNLPLLRTDRPFEVQALEACDVGISECDALIAQTGSVLVTSRSAGGRALSVLPPHHVVLAKREQLLPDLAAGFELLKKKYAPNYPSLISFITGPSRTGDIERILVLGAHGPKQLTILCLDSG